MSEPLKQIQITTLPEGWQGDVFVEVVSAVERDWHEAGRGNVSAAFPALRVTTFTDRARESGAGVKWRGRAYHLDQVHVFAEGMPGFGDKGWTLDTRTYHTGGFRNGSGVSLDWNSPMRKRLYPLADAVRDAFVAEHPDWARESRALRLEWMIRNEERQSAALWRQSVECDERAAKLREELAGL